MSWLSGILGKVAPLAGAVGSLVPGPWGIGLSAVGALGGAMSASDQAKQAQGQLGKSNAMVQAQIEAMQALQKQLQPTLSSYIDMANQTPYSGYTGPDPYSADAQSKQWNGYGEATFGAADQGAASVRNNLSHNGIVSASGIDHEVGNIYNSASNALGGFRRDLSERGAVAKQQQYIDAENARFQRMSPLISLLTGNMGQLNSTIGGQQTLAQNNSNAASGALGGALGDVLARAGTIFGGSSGANAGNNRTGTNQVGSNVFQIPSYPHDDYSFGGVNVPPPSGNLSAGYTPRPTYF